MLFENELIRIIKLATGVQCYLDVVPDAAKLPACAITSIGQSPMNTRELTGAKVGRGTEHRISIIAGSMTDLSNLVKQFELLDNTKNEYFRRIYVDFSSREPFDNDSNVFRAFYNLTAVK